MSVVADVTRIADLCAGANMLGMVPARVIVPTLMSRSLATVCQVSKRKLGCGISFVWNDAEVTIEAAQNCYRVTVVAVALGGGREVQVFE